jgi:RES domain
MQRARRFDPYDGTVWRMVEGQHVVATLQLVDSLAEQAVLEAVLERTKPPVPPDCAHLHCLMYSPFRYGRYPAASRFRRAGLTSGVFYASEEAETAAAETVWYRHRFFAASPHTPLPKFAGEYTAFACRIAAPFAVDLTVPPMSADAVSWTDPVDYSACLTLADDVRAAGCEAIRYGSVRHPDGWPNIAVLTCRAFRDEAPRRVQTWRILLKPRGAQVLREFPRMAVEFTVSGSRLARI